METKQLGLVGLDGNPLRPRKHVNLNAAYDVLTRQFDSDHWLNATPRNSAAIDTRETLQRLRDMSRTEARNNPHLRGLTLKIVNETVGTGPRLSIEPLTVSERSMRAAARVEKLWQEYTVAINFNEKLRLMNEERITAGESFAVVQTNRALDVPIDIRIFEGEQIRSPDWLPEDGNEDGTVDGIKFDNSGNIAFYTRMDHHPYGNDYFYSDQYTDIPKDLCFHWFLKFRPSQYRGVPETAPMLDVYSRLRRFVESKVMQEELRAKITGAIKTAFAPDAGCADLGMDPIDVLIADGQFTTLPDGWEVQMFNLDVTGEGVDAFVRTMLGWATQALLAPWNIVSGDSSDYNFASGRLDHMTFYSYINQVRKNLEDQFLNWYFRKHWYPMARLAKELPVDLGLFRTMWYWDQREPIDPNKAAQAATTLQEAGLLDEVKYWRELGEDAYDVVARQYRYEYTREKLRVKIAEEMGVEPLPSPHQQPVMTQPEEGNDEQEG